MQETRSNGIGTWVGSGRCFRGAMLALLFMILPTPVLAKQDPVSTSLPYLHCFNDASEKHSIPVVLLQAVVATESNWNPSARSHANAHGLMQIQWPGTAKHLGVRRVSQLYEPCTNIKLGTRYLRELLDRYNNDERRALAAYNYGPGRIATTGPIPRGAEKYVATVRRHRSSLQDSRTPLLGTGKERVAVFSSRMRAKRFATLLRQRVPRGTFAVSTVKPGRYELWLTKGLDQLNANDRIFLSSLGWRS